MTATAAARYDAASVLVRVVDDTTGEPVSAARLRLVSSDRGWRVDRDLRCDHDGRAAYLGLRSGHYRLEADADGYAGVDVIGLGVAAGATARLELRLTPIDDAPFRRSRIRYRSPLVNLEDASIGVRISSS